MTRIFSPRSAFSVLLIGLLLFVSYSAKARNPQDTSRTANPASMANPAYCMATHDVGRLGFSVSNFGRFAYGSERNFVDCFTLTKVPQAEYPKASGTQYLYKGGMWIGGVVDGDTLVSAATVQNSSAREFHPDELPFGEIKRYSTLDEGETRAVSEQDYIAVYTDTFTTGVGFRSFDAVAGRSHKPLGIEVTQRSYMWSYGYADDFVLFDMSYRNIGDNYIRDMYVGIYLDADVNVDGVNPNAILMGSAKPTTGGDDDLTGFLHTFPNGDEFCPFEDTLNIAYISDNDGDPAGRTFVLPNITGVKFLRDPTARQKISYNWWVWNPNPNYDFGPQGRATFRYMGGGLGSPQGDVHKYHLLSNGEIDYDQVMALRIESTDPVWSPVNERYAGALAQGADVQYLLSFGPFDVAPGEQFDLPMVYVGGENYHHDHRNVLWNLRNAYRPERYLSRVNFAELAQNAVWADWVYDNPGVDTDSNGFRGPFYLCDGGGGTLDTVYYRGDGAPDFRSATPPPAPKVWVSPTVDGIRIRWNGQESETTPDIFSGLIDFEGYRVYYARDDREASYSLVASYDRENFDKYVFNADLRPDPGYVLEDQPFTIDELRCLYGLTEDPCDDQNFDPYRYSASVPYVMADFPEDSAFYFKPHDYNASQFGLSTDIQKVYPDEPFPTPPYTDDMYTDEGYLKYYEYEFEVHGLLSTVGYYANVTAFDFGSPEADLQPLETSKTLGTHFVYPKLEGESGSDGGMNVFIYPNPYRTDDGYRKKGFEGRNEPFAIPDRIRSIHFANLPPRCMIRIHSLDGDLIREIDHDFPPGDPNSTRDEWNMISRNVQMIVSGIYFWSVENKDTGETQIGKLIVIM